MADEHQNGEIDLTEFLAVKLTAGISDVAPRQRSGQAAMVLQKLAPQELGPQAGPSTLQRTIGEVKSCI